MNLFNQSMRTSIINLIRGKPLQPNILSGFLQNRLPVYRSFDEDYNGLVDRVCRRDQFKREHDLTKVEQFIKQFETLDGSGIEINDRFRPIRRDISKNVQLLKEIGIYRDEKGQQRINVIQWLWEILYDEDLLYNTVRYNILKNHNDWIGQRRFRLFKKACSAGHFRREPLIYPLRKWTRLDQTTNFHPIFSFVEDSVEYEMSDFSNIAKMYAGWRNHIVDQLNFHTETIDQNYKQILFKEDIKQKLLAGKTPSDLFPEHDFEKLYPYCESTVRCLKTFHQAVQETEGAKQWIMNSIDNDNPMLYQIGRHPAVANIGHSGFSMYYSANNIRAMHNMGWKKWVDGIVHNMNL